jgi:hypothetical protein
MSKVKRKVRSSPDDREENADYPVGACKED